MQFCTPDPTEKIFRMSRRVDIKNQHVDFESQYTDTSWHNKNTVFFMSMFPILCPQKEQGDTMHHGSGLEDIDINGYTYIYPNPVKHELNVSCSFSMNKIEIFNSAGQKTEEIPTKGYNHYIDLTKYAKGEYFVKIYTDYGTAVKTFIKE